MWTMHALSRDIKASCSNHDTLRSTKALFAVFIKNAKLYFSNFKVTLYTNIDVCVCGRVWSCVGEKAFEWKVSYVERGSWRISFFVWFALFVMFSLLSSCWNKNFLEKLLRVKKLSQDFSLCSQKSEWKEMEQKKRVYSFAVNRQIVLFSFFAFAFFVDKK